MAKNIYSKKLLLVEGKDEVNVFDKLFEEMEIYDVQIIDIGGVRQFPEKMPDLLKRPGFKSVEIIGICRDGEDNPASSAFQSICSILKNIALPIPNKINEFSNSNPKIGVFVMPNNKDKGMLEDLFLESLKGTDRMQCVEEFCKCEVANPPKNKSKAKMLAFLSTLKEDTNRLGHAVQQEQIDFNSSVFDDLKKFLGNFK